MRATNLTIGTMTLAAIAAGFIGFLSIQKIRALQQRGPLRIVFDGSAAGLRKGGPVNFDGVPAGEIMSIKLETPRKIVTMVMLDNSAPIRKDTVVGIEFQGLTGIAAISLVGGAPAAPPVPLDADGVPILTADLSEQESIPDTLHKVDKMIVDNQETIRDGLLSFETYTASLKSKTDSIDAMLVKADGAFAGVDSAIRGLDNFVPGLADGKTEALYEKIRSLHELADTFRHKSATILEEGRRTLADISESAIKVTRKLDPQAPVASPPAAPRQPKPTGQKRP
jgi:phospholipid/cholesterol/gamma-HCH transport system substrate-binding protein